MWKFTLLVTFSITGIFFLQQTIAAENSPQQEELAPELVTTDGQESGESDEEADGADLILVEVEDLDEESPSRYERINAPLVSADKASEFPVDI